MDYVLDYNNLFVVNDDEFHRLNKALRMRELILEVQKDNFNLRCSVPGCR